MPLGRWQQVLADALADAPAVGVYDTVNRHLGRPPTRAEVTAARRSAYSLAELGRAEVRHAGQTLVLVRPGEPVGSDLLPLRAAAAGTAHRPMPRKPPRMLEARRLRGVVSAVTGAAVSARSVDVSSVDSAEAEGLADTLRAVLVDLHRLERQLRRANNERRRTKNTQGWA